VVACCRLKESFSEAFPSSIVDQLIPPNAVSEREAWRIRVRNPGRRSWSSGARIPQPQGVSRQDCSGAVPLHQRIELNSRRTWFWRTTARCDGTTIACLAIRISRILKADGWRLPVLLSLRNLEIKRIDSKHFVRSGLTIECMYSKMEPHPDLIAERRRTGKDLCQAP
jgi:hypothetical protein